MRVFQVRQGETGAILWTGEATGEIQALDAMAHAAGYRDQSEMPETIRRSGLSVESLSFGTTSALAGGRMMQGGRQGRVVDRTGPAMEHGRHAARGAE